MKKILFVTGMLILVGCYFPTAFADTSLSVTVTPPLFQLSIAPGQSWKSSLKVVNSNPYDVAYYAQPIDFSAEGEGGAAALTPLVNVPTDGTETTYSLARWIQISPEPTVIPKGRSVDISFTVSIPLNAEPGGHYAAILVGTQPPVGKLNGPAMKISSYVSSLLFVKVEGDIQEAARIREFRTDTTLYQKPEAQFLVRFENLGNTHLKPEGVITIYNMWGKKRGEVFVNQERNFGNVLPKSIRKFTFTWSGDESIFDIGLYRAEVTMNFGDKNKQNISAVNYFWVVPVVPVVATISSISLFMLLLVWFIRRYIRRALALEGHMRVAPNSPAGKNVTPVVPEVYTLTTLVQPLREGVVDLRRVATFSTKPTPPTVQRTPLFGPREETTNISFLEYIRAYRTFFLFVIVLLVAGVGAYLFLARVLLPNGSYTIGQVSSQVEEAANNTVH